MPYIVGIDAGPKDCCLVELGPTGVVKVETQVVAEIVLQSIVDEDCLWYVEDFVPYGQRLGHESIATIKAIGVLQHFGVAAIDRPTIKLHLCGVKNAKDADIRDALIHRFGPGRDAAVGTKKNRGPLYGVSGSHAWAALAVAVTAWDQAADKK
jgi:hypothetical protein